MSDTAAGLLALAVGVVGVWMVRYSLRTGKSVTPWPMGPVTRTDNPVLYWFDLTSYIAILILACAAAAMLLLG